MSDNTIKGRYTEKERTFIAENYMKMTDREIAAALNRDVKSVSNQRTKMNLASPKRKKRVTKGSREAYVSTMGDEERKKFFGKEVKASASYKALLNALESEHLEFYVEKYVDFMMDPTIETMTAAEKDSLHTMILAEIKINQYLAAEKKSKDTVAADQVPISKGKEIREMQEVILKCQQNLGVERRMRLKNQSDQAITFSNLVKDLKNPAIRLRAGNEAIMLKFIGEGWFNEHLGTNIISGKDKKFDISRNFKPGRMPEKIDADFTPTLKDQREKDDK
jgi:hypothetical protein